MIDVWFFIWVLMIIYFKLDVYLKWIFKKFIKLFKFVKILYNNICMYINSNCNDKMFLCFVKYFIYRILLYL